MKKIFKKYLNRVKNFFKQEFFSNTVVHWALIGSLFLNGVCWGFLAFFVRPVDFPIILHYNVYFGVDIIGDWWQAYLLPFIGLVVLIVNMFLSYIFFKQKERVISYLLLLASLIVQISALIAAGSIILINY